MNREGKGALVAELADKFGRAKMALVSEYSGLKAAETTDLRRRIRAAAGEVCVAKNTLVRLAIKDTPYAGLEPSLGGPVALIFCYGDPVAAAKTVIGLRELGDRFKLRGAVLGGRPLSAEEVRELASLPPREVVLAQLLGLLQAPASRMVRLLNEPGSALARVIDAIGRKHSEAGGAAAL
jgi:large subunit ribosomal protein L10